VLIPSESLGLFVSYNSDTGARLNFRPFLRVFLDHYYPVSPEPVAVPPDAAERAAQVAGEYLFNRMSYTTFRKAIGLVTAVKVEAFGDGLLLLHTPLLDTRVVAIGPMLYRGGITRQAISRVRSLHLQRTGCAVQPVPAPYIDLHVTDSDA
jgi:hypothetical protein